MPLTPPGVTAYFGPGKPVAEMAAVLNPDYKPAPRPAPEAPPAAATPASPPTVRVPGVTSYFGITPAPAEAPARPNPGYKPNPVAAAPAVAPDAPAPAPAPAAAAPAAPAPAATSLPGAASTLAVCQSTVTAAVKSGPVLFKNALATLRPASIATLDRIAAAFKGCPDARLRVEGHTDNNGAAEMNLKLSQARAQTVADYLASKGIQAGRLSPAGFGLTRPAAPNTSPGNRARNRRIEFIVDKA